MNKYSVRMLSRAARDLDNIYSYIAKELLVPETALAMVEALEKAILSLDTNPYRGTVRKTGAYANNIYRQLLVKNFIIIYRIDSINHYVIIVTVRYASSNF